MIAGGSMKLSEIIRHIEGEVLCGEQSLDMEIKAAFGSDLMSDVLAYCDEDSVLITGLCNNQVVRTAEMLDLRAIIFVRGKRPDRDVIELAEENNMAMIVSKYSLFAASGILFGKGLNGIKL